MKTFDELVKEKDRWFITYALNDMIICNYVSIDILIVYAKQILEIYKRDRTMRGLCIARAYAKVKMASKYPNYPVFCGRYIKDPLEVFFRRDFAKKYISDPNGFDMKSYYWWNVTYLYKYSNDPYKFYEEGMSRFAKPRIMFMNWVINVLMAYKKEYVDV